MIRRGIRNRRFTGVPSPDPRSLGALAWWDHSAGIAVETGVSVWTDQISGFAMSQPVGSLQPEQGANGLVFSTGYQYLSMADTAARDVLESGEFLIAFRWRVTTYGAGDYLFDAGPDSGGRRESIYQLTNDLIARSTNDAGTQSPIAVHSATDGLDVTTLMWRTGGTTFARSNGNYFAIGDSGTFANATTEAVLGNRLPAYTANTGMIGTVKHVVFFNSPLSGGERSSLESWMGAQ